MPLSRLSEPMQTTHESSDRRVTGVKGPIVGWHGPVWQWNASLQM